MNHFTYKGGALSAEAVPLATIAEAVGTPFYAYSQATLERHFKVFQAALQGLDARICFAVKSCPNIAVIRAFAALGAGADVVSEGEIRRALAAGVPPERIVFSGVGKTEAEIGFALDLGIHQINIESEPELAVIESLARARGKRAVIGIRLNPDVDAHTHAKITTGKKENKFGIEWQAAPALIRRIKAMPHVELAALAMHIGSQLTELEPFAQAFALMRALLLDLRAEGILVPRVDVGGGLGVIYEDERNEGQPPAPAAYGALLRQAFGDLGVEIELEPGRVLVGNAGILVSRVVYVKQGSTKTFVICDAAMNDLVRPAMYDAFHDIRPVAEPAPGARRVTVDVVGPVCESGDTFARDRSLPVVKPGDLVAFGTAGAYGAAMSSTYNSRLLVPEVLVKGDAFHVVRPRPTYDAMLAAERIPDWL